jgi:hypothetical protein
MAKIFLGHKTTVGRVVYKRKKHFIDYRDAQRVVRAALIDYFPSDDPNYNNAVTPLKYMLDIVGQRYNEAVNRYHREHPENMEQVYQNFQIARDRVDPDAEWNRIYNLFIDVLNSIARVKDFLGWIPFVGGMLDLISSLWESLRVGLKIEKRFVSVESKKDQKKLKP